LAWRPHFGDHLALYFHPSYGILSYGLAQITTYEFNWLLKAGSPSFWSSSPPAMLT
jgi:hypothetical protein